MNRRLLLLSALLTLIGCGKPTPINSAVFRPDDALTNADLKLFLAIAAQLPEGGLSDAPSPFVTLPKWDSERSLPVKELLHNELHDLDKQWTHANFVARLPKSREFDRVLKRHHISRERFASLAFAFGATLAKSSVAKELDLDTHLKKAQRVVNDLRQDNRPFHTLSPDVSHEVLRKVAWVAEFQRGEKLASVPAQNVKIIERSREKLAKFLPPDFARSPFNGGLDRNLEVAMPFDDLPGNEHYEKLDWNPAEAIIGRDEDNAADRPR